MDTYDLFRKLGSGARFDLKRFYSDAAKFKKCSKLTGAVYLSFLLENLADLRLAERCLPVPGSCMQLAKVKANDFPLFGSSPNLDFFENKSKQTTTKRALHEEPVTTNGKDKERNINILTINSANTKGRNSRKRAKKRKIENADSLDVDVSCVGGQVLVEGTSILWMSSLEEKLNKAQKPKKQTAEKQEQQRIEKVKHFRNVNKIYVHGTDIPEPVATFDQLQEEYNIDPRLMQNVKDAGFQTPTPIQMQAIPLILHTHRELVKLSEGIGFRIHMIDKAAVAAKRFGPKSSKKCDILVTTPNRVIYLLNQDPPGIDLSSVEWLVVDESDKLFEDGKRGFREQLASIFVACTSHLVKRAMFSATFAHDVEQWCKLNLDNVVSVSIGARNSAVDTVEQSLLFVGNETGKLLAMRELIKQGFSPPVLVFVQSIDRAKELFHELIYEGMNVDIIHADRTQQQRDNVIQSFREGKIWILICTSLLARGIDFKGVNMVINYDFPTSAIEYIHRIGRTGRAGHSGKAVSFFTEDDKPLLRSVAGVIQQAGCPVPDYIKHFKKLQSKQKKRVVKNPLKRAHIRTTPKFILEKAHRKRKLIQKKLKEKRDQQEKDKPQSAAES
uniref:ATP-dependent RNA helicase n=1 Tax=Leptobrachium leishanense TaxID=445787 RepID=A0A8C5LYK7_9ANUR